MDDDFFVDDDFFREGDVVFDDFVPFAFREEGVVLDGFRRVAFSSSSLVVFCLGNRRDLAGGCFFFFFEEFTMVTKFCDFLRIN